MTEDLAEILAQRLRPLPFVARAVGLARPVDTLVTEDFDGKQQARRVKSPVAVNYPPGVPDQDHDDRYLLPSEGTASIFFFEDQGTTSYQVAPGLYNAESTLRLLGWLNPTHNLLSEGHLLTALQVALRVNRVDKTQSVYTNLTVRASILPADAALFGKFTYAADVTPLLYPPYRLLGIELKCRYHYQAPC